MRVEGIATQTAKGELTNADSNQSTNENNPYGEVAGQIESQQNTCKEGTTIEYGGMGLAQDEMGYGPFKEDTGKHRGLP